jgi:hypothetical protein
MGRMIKRVLLISFIFLTCSFFMGSSVLWAQQGGNPILSSSKGEASKTEEKISALPPGQGTVTLQKEGLPPWAWPYWV